MKNKLTNYFTLLDAFWRNSLFTLLFWEEFFLRFLSVLISLIDLQISLLLSIMNFLQMFNLLWFKIKHWLPTSTTSILFSLQNLSYKRIISWLNFKLLNKMITQIQIINNIYLLMPRMCSTTLLPSSISMIVDCCGLNAH